MSWKNLRIVLIVLGVIILIVLIGFAIHVLIQGFSALTGWILSVIPSVIKWFSSIDPTIGAALITVFASVFVSSFNSRRAQENAAAEANRGKKVDIYNKFVVSLTEMLNRLKDEGKEPTSEDIKFMQDFSAQIMVHGGPAVIKAYGMWQKFGNSTEGKKKDEQMKMMRIFEKMLFAIRKELGVNNKRLKKNELLGLIIKGGKAELDEMSRGDNS